MTGQIPDTFTYKGEKYYLVGIDGGELAKPENFGMKPMMASTGDNSVDFKCAKNIF